MFRRRRRIMVSIKSAQFNKIAAQFGVDTITQEGKFGLVVGTGERKQ